MKGDSESSNLSADSWQPGDPLADRLRSEAMAERPGFSVELHDRIIGRIGQAESAVGTDGGAGIGRRVAIAAAVIIAVGLGAILVGYLHRTTPGNYRGTIARSVVGPEPNGMPTNLLPVPLAIDFGGVLTARCWPPEVVLRMPMARTSVESGAAQAAPAIGLPGSPEWLLAQLDEQTNNAQTALADVFPAEVRAFFPRAKD